MELVMDGRRVAKEELSEVDVKNFHLGGVGIRRGTKRALGFETSNQTVTEILESEGNEGSDVLCPGARVLEQEREAELRTNIQ